jgi:hypothetical protein
MLTWDQKKRVKASLKFSVAKTNAERDFDTIVTNAALREMFRYLI